MASCGSPYHFLFASGRWVPNSWTASQISSPTLRQSVSFPPKILMCFFSRSTSTACFRDNFIHSVFLLFLSSVLITSGRTPQRSEIISASVSGLSRFNRLLILSSTNCRSSSVTSVSGDDTRVSVVPTIVRCPIGMAKNKRPSSAKKVSTLSLFVICGTIK